MEDLPPNFSPRCRDILRRFGQGQYASMDQFLTANPDITRGELANVTAEITKMTGLTAEDLLKTLQPTPPKKSRKRQASSRAYQIKITLDGSKPVIWRRFMVPAEIKLDKLHDVIQIVMGWSDYHMHLFEIDGRTFSEEPQEEYEGVEECDYRLCDLIVKAKTRFRYQYDFGDDWQHTLVVEKIVVVPPNHYVPLTCLDGNLHCPPEDVGGIHGYASFLKAYRNPKHEEHQEYRDWIGGDFDPKAFDVDTVNRELGKLERWSRGRQ